MWVMCSVMSLLIARMVSPGHRSPRAALLPGVTLEMVNGVLKSRPPTRRKPQGEGPFSVTVWGMFGILDCERGTDRCQAE